MDKSLENEYSSTKISVAHGSACPELLVRQYEHPSSIPCFAYWQYQGGGSTVTIYDATRLRDTYVVMHDTPVLHYFINRNFTIA